MLRPHWILCLSSLTLIYSYCHVTATPLSVSEIQATGKVLFRALRDSECKVKCKSRKSRVMCGSDGVSYLSKCEVKRARRCEGKNVIIRKKGKCSSKDVVMTKCFQEKLEALKSKDISGAQDPYVPECNSDGTYASIQCHQAIAGLSPGYCWCVSKDGKPIYGTSIKNGTPNCNKKVSNDRVKDQQDRALDGKRKIKIRKKKCSRSERTKFNSNLLHVFTEEYNRSVKASPQIRTTTLDPLVHTLDKLVIEWQFSQYDANKDNYLQKKEVKTLRRLVKKFIKPRPCARRFLKYCDSNRDKLVSRTEWSLCLGVDQNKEETTKKPAREISNPLGTIERPKSPFIPGIDSGSKTPTLLKPRPPSSGKTPKDCKTDRANAMEQEADNPNANIFIPNCTDDGKWAEAQCHTSTGYCWCVNTETGAPISGTATQGVPPKCSFEDGERRIPGCTYAEKQSFIAELVSTITKELGEFTANNNTEQSSEVLDPNQTIQERAVRWKYSVLDTDDNNELSSAELKAFKQTINNSRRKNTRKCARKFIRYCDEDGSKKVSIQEWVDCMGISRNAIINKPVNNKRVGTNPFDKYLRDN